MHAQKAAKKFGKLAKKEKGEKKEGKQQQQKLLTPSEEPDGGRGSLPKPPKEKPEKKEKKKKRNRATSQGGSSRYSSEENLLSGNPSRIDAAITASGTPIHEGKKGRGKSHKIKATKSKGCDEAVQKAVTDFWESAWHICAERFFVTSAPVTVSLELRNTWLRIVEAEWQDPDMREHVTNRPNRIFHKDEPPLPLAFDTWARGAMELLPRYRRESVLDPFLRDMDYFKVDDSPPEMGSTDYDEEDLSSPLMSSDPKTTTATATAPAAVRPSAPEPAPPQAPARRSDQQQQPRRSTAAASSAPQPDASVPYDQWDFALDKEAASMDNPMKMLVQQQHDVRFSSYSQVQPSENTTSSSPTQDSTISNEQKSESEEADEEGEGTGTGSTSEKTVMTILPSRPFSDESKSDIESSTPTHGHGVKGRKSQEKKFSPSQCGGKTGSGIFRLPYETTSEALLKMQHKNGSDKRIIGHHVASLLEIDADNMRKSTYQGRKSRASKKSVVVPTRKSSFSEETDDMEIVPLFDQKTQKTEMSDAEKKNSFEFKAKLKASIGVAADFHFDSQMTEKEKKYMKRKLANLQNRVKRQTMRFLANKALVQNIHNAMGDIARHSTGSDSRGSVEIDTRTALKNAKSTTSEPVLSKPKPPPQPNVRPTQPINRQRDPSRIGDIKGPLMKKRPSLMKIPPSIETYRTVSRGPCVGEQEKIARSSDTCLYAKPARRNVVVEESKGDDECYPKNDFFQKQTFPEEKGETSRPS